MLLNFEDYRQKGIRFYKKIARELQAPNDLAYADRLVTCLLWVIRERMPPQESLQFIARFPMHVKGVFVNGWRINTMPCRLRSEEEFLDVMRIKYPRTSGRQLGDDNSLKNDLRAVFKVIRQECVGREESDIKSKLPEALHGLCHFEDGEEPENDRRTGKEVDMAGTPTGPMKRKLVMGQPSEGGY